MTAPVPEAGKALTVVGEKVAGAITPEGGKVDDRLAIAKKIPHLAEASFGELLLLGEALVPTGFLPEHIKTPGQCVAIILAGRELGMAPMRALRSIMLVKGKVTEAADSQLARFKTEGGRAVFKHLDERKAILWLRHPNGDEHEETFTYEDAERAGLTKSSRSGEPSMYHKHPKAMMRSRVITAGLKSMGWEGGAGTYDPDELPVPIPMSTPTAAEAAEAPAAHTPTVSEVRTVEEAVELLVPGAPEKWGGNGGKRFGDVTDKVLRAIHKWADKLITEAGAEGKEPELKVVNWKRGSELVVRSRVKDPVEDGMVDAAVRKQAVATSQSGDPAEQTLFAGEGEEGEDDDLPF